MIQQTSLDAYNSVSINEAQRRVHDIIIHLGPLTDKEIAQHLQWSINRVTPRRGELVRMGLVIKVCKVRQDNNRLAIAWGIRK